MGGRQRADPSVSGCTLITMGDLRRRTLYFATRRPRKLSRSASSGKVICPTRQSIKVGINGNTACPVVATIRLNANRAASRITTKLDMTLADARIVSVAETKTSTQAPVAVGDRADKSGNPFATEAAAMIRWCAFKIALKSSGLEAVGRTLFCKSARSGSRTAFRSTTCWSGTWFRIEMSVPAVSNT